MPNQRRVFLAAAMAIFAAACLTSRVEARLFTLADDPAPAPGEAVPGSPMAGGPACCATAPVCCPKPCIEYRCLFPCRQVCCGCECKPPQKLKLSVHDPCCCKCVVDVPVCVPSCCQGEPAVCGRCGVFGRGVVTYTWCCGYRLNVAFKPCGDVLVTYFGS